jgi:hypothetical protein
MFGRPMAANQCRGLLSLCISDTAKAMLLNTVGFVEHLISGLLLDPDHPRKDTAVHIKAIVVGARILRSAHSPSITVCGTLTHRTA